MSKALERQPEISGYLRRRPAATLDESDRFLCELTESQINITSVTEIIYASRLGLCNRLRRVTFRSSPRQPNSRCVAKPLGRDSGMTLPAA